MGKHVSCVFMDMKKAFDIVDHKLMTEVLRKYGIRGTPLTIFQSYLEERKQTVKIDETRSETANITTGVVQGSCLGPLLFSIFVNAVGSLNISGKIILYADDAVLININDQAENTAMKADFRKIHKFFEGRGMIINWQKTDYMIIAPAQKKQSYPMELEIMPGKFLKRVSTFKYLGLHIDENAKWVAHIDKLRKKLATTNGILWKLRAVLPTREKKLVYDTLFQSHLNYMAPLWGLAPDSSIKPLQVLQNRALRHVYDLEYRCNRVKMYTTHVDSHLPIRGITAASIATYVFGTLHNHTHSKLKFGAANHGKTFRHSDNLRTPLVRTNYGRNSIEHFGAVIYNKLPETIKKCRCTHSFKRALKKKLQDECFIQTCFNSSFFNVQI